MVWVLAAIYGVGLFTVIGYGAYKFPDATAREAYEVTLAAYFWPLYLVLAIPMWIGSSLRRKQES